MQPSTGKEDVMLEPFEPRSTASTGWSLPALLLVAGSVWAATAASPARAGGLPALDHDAVIAAMPAVVAGGAPAYILGGVDESGTWSAAAGVADIRTKAPARPDAEFRIGSISKTFVAVALLQLVQQGKIGLDTPIDR